jgi:hypothetical protein
MEKIKRILFLIWMCYKWEILGQEGITWQEFKTVINKDFCSANHCKNASP